MLPAALQLVLCSVCRSILAFFASLVVLKNASLCRLCQVFVCCLDAILQNAKQFCLLGRNVDLRLG